jgi:hypothetical protein
MAFAVLGCGPDPGYVKGAQGNPVKGPEDSGHQESQQESRRIERRRVCLHPPNSRFYKPRGYVRSRGPVPSHSANDGPGQDVGGVVNTQERSGKTDQKRHIEQRQTA